MYKPKQIILLVTLFAFCLSAAGQKLPNDTTTKKPVGKELFVNVGLQYISNLTYAGRRDSTSVPILLPTLTLISRHGLFLSAIGYFDLNGHSSQAEGLSITPGYVFSFDKKKEVGGAISATKYFITGNSPIILSAFDATIDAQLHYNPADVIKFTLAGSYRFNKNSSQNDIVVSPELSKEIKITKSGTNGKDGLKITPDATLYAGTQSFYQLRQTIVAGTVISQQPEQVRKFDLLAISGSAQLAYNIKTWQISFTPYFIKPFNQVNYANNTPQDGVYFLFTTGVSVTF